MSHVDYAFIYCVTHVKKCTCTICDTINECIINIKHACLWRYGMHHISHVLHLLHIHLLYHIFLSCFIFITYSFIVSHIFIYCSTYITHTFFYMCTPYLACFIFIAYLLMQIWYWVCTICDTINEYVINMFYIYWWRNGMPDIYFPHILQWIYMIYILKIQYVIMHVIYSFYQYILCMLFIHSIIHKWIQHAW